MEEILVQAKHIGLFRSLDIQFAYIIAKTKEPWLMLASACLSAETGLGHVCMPLTILLTPNSLFNGRMPLLAHKALLITGNLSIREWQEKLLSSNAVSDGSHPTPLVLDNQCLYLKRMWQYECIVARFFNRCRSSIFIEEARIIKVLNQYFPSDFNMFINWQKVAAAVAITCPIAIISGGPGTGKTAIITKLIAVLLQLEETKRLKIVVAAPTGRAAARMSEFLGTAFKNLNLLKTQKCYFPQKAITLHHLLGARPNSQQLRYHRKNLLHIDILIIDESSMIDLSMMAKLILALPYQTRVIFLGDRYQLSSVEAGAVLEDICQCAEMGYTPIRCTELSRLTGFTLKNIINKTNYKIADSICLLRKSYRFNKSSGIGKLANAINVGNAKKALILLNSDAEKDIVYINMQQSNAYERMLDDCVNGYRDYLKQVNNHDSPSIILSTFNRFRLLCALREGPFGVTGLNEFIKLSLSKAHLLKRDNFNQCYAGQPVMITCNAPSLGLYNGDIGILLLDNGNIIRAYFSLPDGTIKIVPISRLPEYETAFAITVHKSQGSEFDHTVLVLPNQILPLLTRELLYTATTRACKQLSIYATNEILQHTILTKTQRRSGLIERLSSN